MDTWGVRGVRKRGVGGTRPDTRPGISREWSPLADFLIDLPDGLSYIRTDRAVYRVAYSRLKIRRPLDICLLSFVKPWKRTNASMRIGVSVRTRSI